MFKMVPGRDQLLNSISLGNPGMLSLAASALRRPRGRFFFFEILQHLRRSASKRCGPFFLSPPWRACVFEVVPISVFRSERQRFGNQGLGFSIPTPPSFPAEFLRIFGHFPWPVACFFFFSAML